MIADRDPHDEDVLCPAANSAQVLQPQTSFVAAPAVPIPRAADPVGSDRLGLASAPLVFRVADPAGSDRPADPSGSEHLGALAATTNSKAADPAGSGAYFMESWTPKTLPPQELTNAIDEALSRAVLGGWPFWITPDDTGGVVPARNGEEATVVIRAVEVVGVAAVDGLAVGGSGVPMLKDSGRTRHPKDAGQQS